MLRYIQWTDCLYHLVTIDLVSTGHGHDKVLSSSLLTTERDIFQIYNQLVIRVLRF